ncbi:MAG: Eco57I restriction-modification methylase domain-containing protein, partial [Phascolarctobacterium sp.]|nr:Eco57I restriction-modification methylase domain-containing protein [Phascolarctobacterium sp.]
MADNLFGKGYNPDVLSCLANLSNDEVFTPPEVANKMLDMLPQELFSNPNTTFLDPACKSGIFLREIAKRLIKGLEKEIPDLQERLDHIFHKQLYGIAITEMTSLLSRRSVYCSKYPNSKYSVSKFNDIEGNIRYKNIAHSWVNGKCKYCGASKSEYGGMKRDGMETHAYEFIHTDPEEIYKMKFDVIVGNPPYQLNTGTVTAQAVPLYDKFVSKAKLLEPKYLCMIIPSRWYAGGMGLDGFRREMLSDKSISVLVDYPNAKECFSGISIGGGVCYFLRDKNYSGDCNFINISNNNKISLKRNLSEFEVFVRYNEAVRIIKKVKAHNDDTLETIVSSLSTIGINSSERGVNNSFDGAIVL